MRILNPAGRDSQQTRLTSGGIPPSGYKSVATDYEVQDDDGTVAVSTMRGVVTITLPRAAVSAGRQLVIRKADSGTNPVYIKSANSETIAGASMLSLAESGEYAQFVSDGNQWSVPLHFTG
jgi:hypothetical protein